MSTTINDHTLGKVTPEEATGETKELFEKAVSNMGMIPHLFHNLATSPKVLSAFIDMQMALESGLLNVKEQESIALRVAELNCAGYCVSMHHYVGEHMAEMSNDEMIAARTGKSDEPKIQALLDVTDMVLANKGAITPDQMNSARIAGVSDGELVEVIANVTWNLLANYVDGFSSPTPDVPQIGLLN